jgi:hypothetical protein
MQAQRRVDVAPVALATFASMAVVWAPARSFYARAISHSSRTLRVESSAFLLAAATVSLASWRGPDQALSAEHMTKKGKKLEEQVHRAPKQNDSEIARLKLRSMGIDIDKLTPEQKPYLASWQEGT